MMQNNYTSKGKHLTESERQLIERWKNKERLSNREIAYCLGKAPQTINNEVKRGTIQLKTKWKYSSKLAQATYASHERGTNENHNRMIRRHLPKGTKKTTKQFVAYIEQ